MIKMMKRLAVIAVTPLLLSGCLVMPGKFGSTLDLRKDGSFTFAYKGEILFQSPDEMMKGKPKVWNDDMASCYRAISSDAAGAAAAGAAAAVAAMETAGDAVDAAATEATEIPETSAADAAVDAAAEESSTRPCSKKEIADQRKEWEESQRAEKERKAKESEKFASMFGFAGGDEKALTAFAARLAKYRGWKSVVHQGKGRFLVDYQISGKVSHDFIFPVLPEGDVVFPFVQIRGREAGKVYVNTPALLGGGLSALAARGAALGASMTDEEMPDVTGIVDGSFTITTDGDVLTNNSEDGPTKSATGKTIVWKVDASTKRIPEALIQLD